MKNFIKIFFIIVCFFISLTANAKEISYDVVNTNIHYQYLVDSVTVSDEPELVLSGDVSENSIVSANNQTHEISASSSRKDSFNGSFIQKASAQNKHLQQIFSSNYNNIINGISHKISPHLKNEICTRAP